MSPQSFSHFAAREKARPGRAPSRPLVAGVTDAVPADATDGPPRRGQSESDASFRRLKISRITPSLKKDKKKINP